MPKRGFQVPITEKQFMSSIIQFARLCGWQVFHPFDSRKSTPGFPDLVLCKHTVLFRELKTDTGKLTPAQKDWGESLKAAGADWAVWRPAMKKEIYHQLLHGKESQ